MVTRQALELCNPYLMDGESELEMLLHRAWQEGHDAALRAQAEAGTAWTAEELEELRGLAWVFGPENNGQFALTHGRAPDDTLSLAQMLDPDPRVGRRFPELQALIQFTTRELLLIHRGLRAALAQAGGES